MTNSERNRATIFTEVQNGTLLRVNKTSLQKAVRRGEEVSYVIKVCNSGGQPATNVTVRDVFDSSVEFVSAWPAMTEDGVWKYASLEPGECVQISLTVRVPRIDVKYESHQTIRGKGFVRTYRDYTTSRDAIRPHQPGLCGLRSDAAYGSCKGLRSGGRGNGPLHSRTRQRRLRNQ